jgi:hypothetical protein
VATLAPVFSSTATGDVAVLGSGGSSVIVPSIGSSIAGLLFNTDSPAYQFSGGTLTVGNNASIVNQSTSEITFANKEMLSLVSLNAAKETGNAEATYERLKERLGLFRLKNERPK